VPRRACSAFEQPATLLGPHTAALGMRFYRGTGFGAAYENQIFTARRGRGTASG
jgi:glucose/arabinose dehydrogenase